MDSHGCFGASVGANFVKASHLPCVQNRLQRCLKPSAMWWISLIKHAQSFFIHSDNLYNLTYKIKIDWDRLSWIYIDIGYIDILWYITYIYRWLYSSLYSMNFSIILVSFSHRHGYFWRLQLWEAAVNAWLNCGVVNFWQIRPRHTFAPSHLEFARPDPRGVHTENEHAGHGYPKRWKKMKHTGPFYKTSERHEQKTHSTPIKVSGITASPADVDLEARILMWLHDPLVHGLRTGCLVGLAPKESPGKAWVV